MLSKGKAHSIAARRERDYTGAAGRRSGQPALGEAGLLWAAYNRRALESRKRHERRGKGRLPIRLIRRMQNLLTGLFS